MIYLDNAATTAVTKPVLDEMLPYFTELYGNPSSTHSMGRAAKEAVQQARKRIADAINAEPEQIFFTSGATESNNWIGEWISCISHYEHPSLSMQGTIDKMYRTAKLNKYKNIVSHIWVNNETGRIYDIHKWCDAIHSMNGEQDFKCCFHTDATQAFGHVLIDVKNTDVDFMSLSGHKFHAPKGIGILYVKDVSEFRDNTHNYNFGGGQERGLRSGTENVASIVGMGKAAQLYNYQTLEAKGVVKNLWDLHWYIVNYIAREIPHSYFTLQAAERTIPNIVSVAFADVYSGDLQEMLSDLYDIHIGTGSACSSNHKGTSETILNSWLAPYLYDSVIRISMSDLTTAEEVKTAMPLIKQCVEQIRAVRGA